MAAWIVLAVSAAHADGTKQPPAEMGKGSPPAPISGVSPPSAVANSAPESLFTTQQQLAAEFKDLQGILMRMRDQVRQTDPSRAVLIEKALKESGERHVEADFQDIVDLLHHDKFGDAARKQDKVNEDLDAILKLLLSEDRSQGILDEKALIRKYLNLLNGIIREQKDVQGRTAGGEDPKSLSGEQGGLAERTGNLSKDIHEDQEKARSKDDDKGNLKNDGKGDGKAGEKSDGKTGEKSDGKTKPGDGKTKPGDGKNKPGEGREQAR